MRKLALALLVCTIVPGAAFAQMPNFNDMTAPFKDVPAKMKEIPDKLREMPDKFRTPADGSAAKPNGSAPSTQPVPASTSRRVDINRASVAELKTLPGIDEALARNIVDGRPYKGTSDLEGRKIIPSQAYEGIKTRISVNAGATGSASKPGAGRRCYEAGGRLRCRDN